MAASLGKEISMPQQAACQTLQKNHPAENLEENFKHLLSIPFLDHLCKELSERFKNAERLAIDALSLVPATFVYNTASVNGSEVPEGLNVLKEHWAADLPNCEKVEMEYRMWVEKS